MFYFSKTIHFVAKFYLTVRNVLFSVNVVCSIAVLNWKIHQTMLINFVTMLINLSWLQITRASVLIKPTTLPDQLQQLFGCVSSSQPESIPTYHFSYNIAVCEAQSAGLSGPSQPTNVVWRSPGSFLLSTVGRYDPHSFDKRIRIAKPAGPCSPSVRSCRYLKALDGHVSLWWNRPRGRHFIQIGYFSEEFCYYI